MFDWLETIYLLQYNYIDSDNILVGDQLIGLEYILELYGMQQIELAEKLGIKKQNINLWIKKTKDLQKTFTYVGTNFWHRR